MAKKTELVTSFDGLYDEMALAETYNIANRKWHWGPCRWINASLYFSRLGNIPNAEGKRPEFHVSLEADAGQFSSEWGKGYGGIRFCVKCKQIHCIHIFNESTSYEIAHSKYYSTWCSVSHCRACSRRIKTVGWGASKGSPQAFEIITAVAIALGKDISKYGSGWQCELPVAVSRILDERGHDAAVKYVESCFAAGSSESAVTYCR